MRRAHRALAAHTFSHHLQALRGTNVRYRLGDRAAGHVTQPDEFSAKI